MQVGPGEWCYTWRLRITPWFPQGGWQRLHPFVDHTQLLGLGASLARMSVMDKGWWEQPSGIQNDYFAPSQRGAEHASCAGSIHVPHLQGCWLNSMLMGPQGLCFATALTQLDKHVLLLLSALWWPYPIILNPLLLITGFRNILQPQPRLCFLSASDGYTTSTVNIHLMANLTKTSQDAIRLKNWTMCLSE